jgi:general secretion pathway protein L
MDTSLQSLVNEIRRWEIGFRVKNGTPVTCFYTCGGSANIKNINHYFKSNLNTEVKPFNPYPTCNDRKFDQEPKYRAKFSQAVVMAQMSRTKTNLINFLRGDFALNGNASLPIHNLVFLGVRASFVAVLVSSFFLLDTMMVKRDLKVAKKRSTELLKQPIFKISGREIRRVLVRNPEKILSKLNKQNRQFEQEVKMIQSSVKTNAVKSLNDIIAMVSGFDVEILQFHSLNSDEFNLQLKAKSVKVIDELEALFNSSQENKFFVEKDPKNLTINISGEEKS